MKKQTDFETRVARIQARANGTLPPQPIIAPLVGEELEPKKKRRGGFRILVLALATTAFVGGAYSSQLVALLPADIVASSEILTSIANSGLAGLATDGAPAQAKVGL